LCDEEEVMPNITPEQYREFQARQMRGVPHSPSPEQLRNILVDDESDLHSQIIDYCKEKGWQYLHGSMAARTHRTLGEPDFIILARGSQLRMVECKSKTGKLSLDQQGFIAHAAMNGHVVYVVRSMEEFKSLFT
jgi:VRR-NUC domain